MENNNQTSFILIAGIIILIVFGTIVGINLVPTNESKSYYVKVGDEMSAKIEAMRIENQQLKITTSGDAIEYCVKSTKTNPEFNSICWKKIEKNTATISIYKYKKYYIWIKDTNGQISVPMSINTKDAK